MGGHLSQHCNFVRRNLLDAASFRTSRMGAGRRVAGGISTRPLFLLDELLLGRLASGVGRDTRTGIGNAAVRRRAIPAKPQAAGRDLRIFSIAAGYVASL